MKELPPYRYFPGNVPVVAIESETDPNGLDLEAIRQRHRLDLNKSVWVDVRARQILRLGIVNGLVVMRGYYPTPMPLVEALLERCEKWQNKDYLK